MSTEEDNRPIWNDTFLRTSIEINRRINVDSKEKFVKGIYAGISIFTFVAILYVALFIGVHFGTYGKEQNPNTKLYFTLQSMLGATQSKILFIMLLAYIVVMFGTYVKKYNDEVELTKKKREERPTFKKEQDTVNLAFMICSIIIAAIIFIRLVFYLRKIHNEYIKYGDTPIPNIKIITADKTILFGVFLFVYFCILSAFLLIERVLRRFLYYKGTDLEKRVNIFDQEYLSTS